jgi:hypothetical protein
LPSFIKLVKNSIYSHDLPEPDEDDIVTVLSDERDQIANSLNACLAPINAPDEPTHPLDMKSSDLSTLSFDKLVHLRRKHQTRQAATSVRKKMSSGRHQSQAKAPTKRQLLIRRFQEVIKQQQEQGRGTGAERGLRWRTDPPAAGNAANAAEAAKTRHKQVHCFHSIWWSLVN